MFCSSTPQMPPVLAKVCITLKCPATKPQPPLVHPGRARALLGARNSRRAARRRKRSALFLAATHLCFPLLRSRAERSENRLWHRIPDLTLQNDCHQNSSSLQTLHNPQVRVSQAGRRRSPGQELPCLEQPRCWAGSSSEPGALRADRDGNAF